MHWTVSFHSDVKKFNNHLDPSTRGEVYEAIKLLENYGPFVGMPYSKKINSHLYELRIRGRQEIRILYSISEDQITLLNAFRKQSQKLPLREIVTALKRLKSLT